jgi:hypothetical protein
MRNMTIDPHVKSISWEAYLPYMPALPAKGRNAVSGEDRLLQFLPLF